jgi:hypothetical protein
LFLSRLYEPITLTNIVLLKKIEWRPAYVSNVVMDCSLLYKMVRRNNFKGDSLVTTEFGIQVKEEQPLVEARVLPPPMVIFGLCLFELFRLFYAQI